MGQEIVAVALQVVADEGRVVAVGDEPHSLGEERVFDGFFLEADRSLLATFYGAAVANLFCLPIADKLHLKLVDEEINRTLIIDGILMIREAKSPTLVREMLLAYLPEKHRHSEEDEAELAPA
jgi:hypothetical protein